MQMISSDFQYDFRYSSYQCRPFAFTPSCKSTKSSEILFVWIGLGCLPGQWYCRCASIACGDFGAVGVVRSYPMSSKVDVVISVGGIFAEFVLLTMARCGVVEVL